MSGVVYLDLDVHLWFGHDRPALKTYAEVQERLELVRKAIAVALDVELHNVDAAISMSAGEPEDGWPEDELVTSENEQESGR